MEANPLHHQTAGSDRAFAGGDCPARDLWILYYQRQKAISVQRRLRESQEFQIKRKKAQKERMEAAVQTLAEKSGQPAFDIAVLADLEKTIMATVSEVDEILERGASEHDHNRALELSLGILALYDKLIHSATTRRTQALKLLADNRESLGALLRGVVEQIDTAATKTDEPSPPLADDGQQTAEVVETPVAPNPSVVPALQPNQAAEAAVSPLPEEDEVDPLDCTRHWSYRTDVLRRRARGENI